MWSGTVGLIIVIFCLGFQWYEWMNIDIHETIAKQEDNSSNSNNGSTIRIDVEFWQQQKQRAILAIGSFQFLEARHQAFVAAGMTQNWHLRGIAHLHEEEHHFLSSLVPIGSGR